MQRQPPSLWATAALESPQFFLLSMMGHSRECGTGCPGGKCRSVLPAVSLLQPPAHPSHTPVLPYLLTASFRDSLCCTVAFKADSFINSIIIRKIIAHLITVTTAFIFSSTVSATLGLRRLLKNKTYTLTLYNLKNYMELEITEFGKCKNPLYEAIKSLKKLETSAIQHQEQTCSSVHFFSGLCV